MKHRRIATASWMLVPIVLAAPALVAGLSLWFDWGPQWTALALALAAALLALLLDFRRALRFGLIGALVGLITCPLLLLLGNPSWRLYTTWVAWAAALPALLTPLLFAPPQDSRRRRPVQQVAPADAEALEQLAAIQRTRRD